MSKSFSTAMTELFDKYTAETGDNTPELKSVASWAINNGHYDIPFESKIKRFCEELRNVLGKASHATPSGKKMRTYQCVRSTIKSDEGQCEQQFLWADVRTADPFFVLKAFRERHHSSRDDVRALQADVEAWNESYRPSDVDPISLDWDFSKMQDDEG